MKCLYRKNIFLIGIINLFTLLIPINLNSLASEISINEDNRNSPKELTRNSSPQYIIDSEDIFFIGFYGLEIFSNNYKVDGEGYFFLPEIGYLYTRGLTISELQKKLEENFKQYIDNPEIVLKLISTRPITVSLVGEINRPGLYTLGKETDYTKVAQVPKKDSSIQYQIFNDKRPKLFNALQEGLGLTNSADLSNVQVLRKIPLSQGGGQSRAVINLLSLLEKGDQDQNITLQDKDIIIVSKTNVQQIDQLLSFNRTNLYPESIQVFINGHIQNNGRTVLKPGTSLMEALSAAGGKSFKSGKVEFIRLNRNGKNDKRLLSFNTNEKKGTYKNPILLEGDILYVRKNLFGKTSEFIKEYATPIVSSYGVYRIFN